MPCSSPMPSVLVASHAVNRVAATLVLGADIAPSAVDLATAFGIILARVRPHVVVVAIASRTIPKVLIMDTVGAIGAIGSMSILMKVAKTMLGSTNLVLDPELLDPELLPAL